MKSLLKFALPAAFVLAVISPPAMAQTSVPLVSVKRLSLGLTAEYVFYRPQTALLGLKRDGEIKLALPVAYNLGRFSSLQGKVRYGIDSAAKEYSVGLTFHILARGSTP